MAMINRRGIEPSAGAINEPGDNQLMAPRQTPGIDPPLGRMLASSLHHRVTHLCRQSTRVWHVGSMGPGVLGASLVLSDWHDRVEPHQRPSQLLLVGCDFA